MSKVIISVRDIMNEEVKRNKQILKKQLKNENEAITKYCQKNNYSSNFYVVVFEDKIVSYSINEFGLISDIEKSSYIPIDEKRAKRLRYIEIEKGTI